MWAKRKSGRGSLVAQWVKDLALLLLWLWVWSLAWELQYATPKHSKKPKQNERKKGGGHREKERMRGRKKI